MLRLLTESISSSRGSEITRSFDYDKLKQLLNEVKGSSIKPLDPLLDKIAGKVAPFANDDVRNGLVSVGWCIDHGLVPQGFTLLQETLISMEIADHFGKDAILDQEKRELVAQALNIGSKAIPEPDWKEAAHDHPDDIRAILEGLPPGFLELFDGLSQARNDINHGGFSSSAAKPGALEARLREYYRRATTLKGNR